MADGHFFKPHFFFPTCLLRVSSSATDEAWRLLASYLDRYPSANAQQHRYVINKLLSHDVPLPDWLVKSYKVGNSASSSSLLAAFCLKGQPLLHDGLIAVILF